MVETGQPTLTGSLHNLTAPSQGQEGEEDDEGFLWGPREG